MPSEALHGADSAPVQPVQNAPPEPYTPVRVDGCDVSQECDMESSGDLFLDQWLGPYMVSEPGSVLIDGRRASYSAVWQLALHNEWRNRIGLHDMTVVLAYLREGHDVDSGTLRRILLGRAEPTDAMVLSGIPLSTPLGLVYYMDLHFDSMGLHDQELEAAVVPVMNPYSEANGRGTVVPRCTVMNGDVDGMLSGRSFRKHPTASYSLRSVWNVAVKARRSGMLTTEQVAAMLYAISTSGRAAVVDVFTTLHGDGEVKWCKTGMTSGYHVNVPPEAMRVFEEVGLRQAEVETALAVLMDNGSVSRRILEPGSPLYRYCDDQRYAVARVLNYVSTYMGPLAESDSSISVRTGDQAVDGGRGPVIDALTGMPVGIGRDVRRSSVSSVPPVND